jgi:hypothetical protein
MDPLPVSLGYRQVGKQRGKPNQRRAWIYEPTGKKEYMTLDQMRYRHARGLLQEVYREPPLTKYMAIGGGDPNDKVKKMFQDMAQVNLPAFALASPFVQHQAIVWAKEWLPRVKRFEALTINRAAGPLAVEAQMLAFAFCLNAMTLDRAHEAIAVIYRRDDAWGANTLVPEYRFINEDTVHLLNNMINHMFHGDAEFEHDYSDSDKLLQYNLSDWVQMKILFKPAPHDHPPAKNRGAGRVRVPRAGFFPLLSSYALYDLSRFGIYHEFDLSNYQEMCFIQCFREYMEAVWEEARETTSRDLFNKTIEADCEFLRSIIKTFRIRMDCLRSLSELLNINIIRRAYNEEKKKVDPPVRYLRKNPRFQKDFEILYHSGHFMIWEPKICTKLKLIKKLGLFTAIPQDQEDLVKRVRLKAPIIQARFYSEYCCAPMEMKRPFRTGLDSFFMMDDIQDKAATAQRLSELLHINVLQYSSLAALGQALIHKHGGYKGVMGLRGTPAEFIRKCLCPIVLGAPHDRPIRVEGDLCQYDRKSSYPSVYTCFPGIPIGKPIEIDGKKGLSQLNDEYDPDDPEDQCHFYVCLDIKSYRSLHADDPYPMLTHPGLRYMDRTQYELIMKHYEVDYDFVSGYYFEGYNRAIGKLAMRLFNMRAAAGRDVSLALKRLMNSMWGKAMCKGFPVRDKNIPDSEVEAFCQRQYPYVYKRSPRPDGSWNIRIVRPILADLSCPQFSVNVSSWSRRVMQETIYSAVDHGIPIFYSNTDCLCLREPDVPRLAEASGRKFLVSGAGAALGDFVREHQSRKFICLSQKKYIHCLKSGGSHVCYGPRSGDPEKYFERLFTRSPLCSPSRSRRSSSRTAS